MPPTATPAQQQTTINTLDGMITGYTPKPPPAGKKPLGGKPDANATLLLNQMKAKGIGVRMINLFISSGGTLNLVGAPPPKPKELSTVVASYNPDTKTITVGDNYMNNGSLRLGLPTTQLAGIAHEFWHAYKAQIVDGGFDPDTAAAFSNLKTWLDSQPSVTFNNNGSLGKTTTFADVNPGYFNNRFFETTSKFTDDFADEYVAQIMTELFSFAPYNGGDHPIDRTYNYLGRFLTEHVTAYFNDNGKNYRINAAPPPDLILQIERLVINRLNPATPAAGATTSVGGTNGSGTGTGGTGASATGGSSAGGAQASDENGGSATPLKGEVAPEHTSLPQDDPGYEYAGTQRDTDQPQVNCFGDAACERAIAQARGQTNLDFGDRFDPRGSGDSDRRRGTPDICNSAGTLCAPIPGLGGVPTGGGRGR